MANAEKSSRDKKKDSPAEADSGKVPKKADDEDAEVENVVAESTPTVRNKFHRSYIDVP